VTVGRAVFEPGWRWSEDVRHVAGTDSCQVEHVGYGHHVHAVRPVREARAWRIRCLSETGSPMEAQIGA